MLASWIATVVVIGGAATSAAFYRHDFRSLATEQREKIVSLKSYRYVYRYLQISTIIVSLTSFWSDNIALLRLYSSELAIIIGIVISLLGLGLFIWAMLSIGSSLSPCYDSYMPNELITKGPYGWIRHPIYSSNMLQLVGLFIATGSLIIAFNTLVMMAYYVIAARHEEEALRKRFPEYRSLISRTGVFLPRIFASGSSSHQ